MTYYPPPPPITRGMFSSLPLTFFSTSVPIQIIDLYTSNGGTSLPHPIPPNLFISEFNDKHPFYNVDLFFIAGPSDPLMTLLQRRTLVLYDCGWVEESVKTGKMVPLERYVLVPERIKIVEQVEPDANVEGEEGSVGVEGNLETRYDERTVNPTKPPAQTSIGGQAGEQTPLTELNPASVELGNENEIRLKSSDRLSNLQTVYVDHTAFISQEAIINAVHKRPTTISKNTASPRLKSKNPTSSSINSKSTSTTEANMHAGAGPSRLHLAPLVDDTEHNDEFIAFQPTSTPSRPPTSSRHISSSPVRLHIPHKILNQKKVSRFIKKFQNSVQCELDDVYVRALEGEWGGYKIMGLEEGRLD